MEQIVEKLCDSFTKMIAETNGINLNDTIELMLKSYNIEEEQISLISEFSRLLHAYHDKQVEIESLLEHPVGRSLFRFFRKFPLRFCEEHIHLTGSLSSDFIFRELKPLLEGENGDRYTSKVKELFGKDVRIDSEEDLERLVRLGDREEFDRYLKILELPALILKDRETHTRAAYHMAKELYEKHNVGRIRLKFTYSRISKDEKILTTPSNEVALGLFEGFKAFKCENPDFDFTLSPSFRKEADYYNARQFASKKEDFDHQVNSLIALVRSHPGLAHHMTEVDTVGNERDLYRKGHFRDMQDGFRKLQRRGFQIRSHHGEMWNTLRHGIQAVDNAMNIWHIDNLEHGISLGINPNYYFQALFQRILDNNQKSLPVKEGSREYREILQMQWKHHGDIRDHILKGRKLNPSQIQSFTKAKFRTATEIEHYQHDVLNRMIQKKVSLVALPSSNKRLTGSFSDYKDHPFSWWEKKGVHLGVGTDNYITLNTNLIKEMLILLFSDPDNLKITKLIMVTTGEKRRTYLSDLLWQQRRKLSECNP